MIDAPRGRLALRYLTLGTSRCQAPPRVALRCQEAWVNTAFFSAATPNPAYAELLREGYSHLLGVSWAGLRAAAEAGELAPGVDPFHEATALYFLAQGLIGPVLVGVLDAAEAVGVVEHQLDRLFRQ